MHLISPQKPDQRLRIDIMINVRFPYYLKLGSSLASDGHDTPPRGQDPHSPPDMAVRQDDVAAIEETRICCRLARQPFKSVASGLDLEAIHGRADYRYISTLVRTGHPRLMRKTRQTSQYIQQMGPFFIGKAVWQTQL